MPEINDNNGLLQKEAWKQKTLEVTAAPLQQNASQQVEAEHQTAEKKEAPQFAQPVGVTKTAVIPTYAEVSRQRQLTWKEKQAQKKEAKQREKLNREIMKEHTAFSAEALKTVQGLMKKQKIARVDPSITQKEIDQEYTAVMDAMVAQMKAHPLHGVESTNYHGTRSTLALTENAEHLERVAMTYVTDPAKLQEVMQKVRSLTKRSEEMDRAANDFRFRNQNLPVYILDVLGWNVVPARIDALLGREAEHYSDVTAKESVRLQQECSELTNEIFKLVPAEELGYAKGVSLRKGKEAKAYNKAIETLMEEKKVSRDEARHLYFQNHLAELEKDKVREQAAKDKIDQTFANINQLMPAARVKKLDWNNKKDKKDLQTCLDMSRTLLDELEKQLMEHPPMTARDISADRIVSTVVMVEHAEYLERVILTQIKDPGQAKKLLKQVRKFTAQAEVYDERSKRAKFRQTMLPLYMDDILHKNDKHWAVREQLKREGNAYTRELEEEDLEKTYHQVEDMVFALLTAEQKKLVKSEDMKTGVHAKSYNQVIEDIMEEQKLTREKAKDFYAEILMKNMHG